MSAPQPQPHADPPAGARRLYRLLLHAYPRALRDHVGDEMLAMFCARYRDERARRGGRGLALLWLRTFLDVARNAPAERFGGRLDAFIADIRYGTRSLVRRPSFLAVAVLTLALGVGANTAIFSMVNAVLLRSLPFPHAEQLVFVWETAPGDNALGPSYPVLLDWRAGSKSFAGLGAWRGQSVNVTGDGEPERVPGAFVTADFFGLLGAQPLLGRGITPAEADPASAQPVAILSYGLWQRRFGADPKVLGQTLALNGRSHTIVGVMGPDFANEREPANGFLMSSDVWLPLPYFPNAHGLERGHNELLIVGRLKPGVAAATANSELSVISAGLASAYPDTQKDHGVRVERLRDRFLDGARSPLFILFGAVGLVLLIACVNVANLLLARASQRDRELAVRAALGASRPRLVRQLLTESLLIGLLGGGAGLLASAWVLKALVAITPASLSLPADVSIDRPTLLYALAISVGTGLLFGVVPALRASRPDVNGILRGAAPGLGSGRFRDGLVVVEAALSLILLVGAGLLMRSAAERASVDPGFRTDHMLTAQLRLPPTKYPDPPRIAALFRDFHAALQAAPGVESAALVRATPFGGNPEARDVYSADTGDHDVPVNVNTVSPGYFRTMGVQTLAGRDFAPTDTADKPHVALVNATLAARAFPDGEPLGRTLDLHDHGKVTVIGVVADTRHRTLTDPPRSLVYVCHEQNAKVFTEVVVRTSGDPTAFIPTMRSTLWSIDKDQPIWALRSMDQLLENQRRPAHALGLLVTLFAALALVLAGVGLYGVMSYTVSVRIREIGIRMALGATATRVVGQVVGRALLLAAAAVAVGLVAALALGRLIASVLYGISPADPLTFAAAAAILLLTSGFAAWLPARRASRVAPTVALAQE